MKSLFYKFFSCFRLQVDKDKNKNQFGISCPIDFQYFSENSVLPLIKPTANEGRFHPLKTPAPRHEPKVITIPSKAEKVFEKYYLFCKFFLCMVDFYVI